MRPLRYSGETGLDRWWAFVWLSDEACKTTVRGKRYNLHRYFEVDKEDYAGSDNTNVKVGNTK